MSKIKRITDRLPLIAFATGLVLFALYLAAVATMRYVVERQLHPALPKGTTVGEVHLNPLRGSLEVRRFYLRNEDEPRIRIDSLVADVDMLQIFRGALVIERIQLRDAYFRVDRREDGSLDLGLPEFGGDAGEEDSAPPPNLSLKGLLVEGLKIDFYDGDMRSAVELRQLKVSEYSLLEAKQEISVFVDLLWDGQQIVADTAVTLDDADVAVAGSLQTDLLDLARAQRLARLEPQVIGQAGFEGDITWRGDQAAAAGRLRTPSLDFGIAGREVSIVGAEAEAIDLDLEFDPLLVLTLDLGPGLVAESYAWAAEGEKATGRDVRWLGRVEFRAGADAVLDNLRLSAASVDWSDGPRSVVLSGLKAAGRMAQAFDSDDVLPQLDLTVQAETVRFADQKAPVSVAVGGLTFERLVLGQRQDEAGRPLSVAASIGNSEVRQAGHSIVASDARLTVEGLVSIHSQQIAGDLEINAVSVETQALPHGPLTIDGIEVGGFQAGGPVSAARLAVRGLSVPGGPPDTALNVAAIGVEQLSFDAGQGASIGDIVVDGLQTGVVRDKAGVWQHVMTPSVASDASIETPGKEAATGETAALPWRLGGLRVIGDSHITVADALNPDMQPIRYAVETIKVGGLDSSQPDADTAFEIALKPDRYSEFRIAGTTRPLGPTLYLDAEGHLHGFGLTSVNGLIANDLGHRFLDGQLDNDFRIKIDSAQLDMGNQLSMSALDVEEIPDKEGPPLGTAIALLEDRDGNVKLEVPVSGDLGDPDFRVLGALNPIIMKAVAGTAALAIQPFGSVLLVGGLLADQALKVTFEPATFDPSATALNAVATDYLEQLSGKLKEKPKLGVKVCGVVVASEREKNNKGEFTDDPEALLMLAQQRADAVSAFMREQGLGKTQVRKCRPRLDPTEEGLPRVDIRF